MRLRDSDRVADYARPASVAHENNWAFVHRESGITGTVYQQKCPHAAGMEWYARTEEGHVAIVRSRVQAVDAAVADQKRENLNAALTTARIWVESLVPQRAPTLDAPAWQWQWTDGGAVMNEVELMVRELHECGAKDMIVPLPNLGSCIVTKSGRVELAG